MTVEMLTLTNHRDGSTVLVEVDPDMSAFELTEKLKEKGVISREEAASFGIIDETGNFSPRPIGSVRDLIEAARAGKIVAFHPERIHGSNYMTRLCSTYSLRWNSALKMYTAIYVSRYDGRQYLIAIKPARTFYEPPSVYIIPYPEYVEENSKFEEMHVRSCLFKIRSESGKEIGYWHIDEENWRRVSEESKLILVMESLIQLLGFYPSY